MRHNKNHIRVAKPDYSLNYDLSLLNGFNFENLRIIFKTFLCLPPKSQTEGLYFRILESSQGKCIQCLFFYKIQWIPYHPHDYHPFYIYLDENNYVKNVIIDDGHHFSKLIPLSQKTPKSLLIISLFLPDHGLTNQINLLGKTFNPHLIPLLPEQISEWWFINNMAQLKLRTKLVDPWAHGLIPKTASKHQSLLFRLNHIIPFKIFPSDEINLQFTFRDEAICPTCQHHTTLDFMPLIYDESLGKYYLHKEMVCPNRHRYIACYNFETTQLESKAG
jgi:hypothetical protein